MQLHNLIIILYAEKSIARHGRMSMHIIKGFIHMYARLKLMLLIGKSQYLEVNKCNSPSAALYTYVVVSNKAHVEEHFERLYLGGDG